MKNPDIEIEVWSNVDYERLIAEIYYKGKFIALLNQDDGLDRLKIEFAGPELIEDKVTRKIDLAVFEEALELAKQKIRE